MEDARRGTEAVSCELSSAVWEFARLVELPDVLEPDRAEGMCMVPPGEPCSCKKS